MGATARTGRGAGISGRCRQRSLDESMARSLWPQSIRVALIVVDAVVDLPRTRRNMPDKPDDFFLRSEDMAASAVSLREASIALQPWRSDPER